MTMTIKNIIMMNLHHIPQLIFICIDLILSIFVLVIRMYFFTSKRKDDNDFNISSSLQLKILHALQMSAHDTIPESIFIEKKNLATGKHASAYRVRGIFPKNKTCGKTSDIKDEYSTAIFKIWKPSTIYDALSWLSATFELRVYRLLIINNNKIVEKAGYSDSSSILYHDDYKSYLSRNAQYLASFEVETSLYQADGGLGYGTHKIGNVIGAPNSYLIFSNIINIFSFKWLFETFTSIDGLTSSFGLSSYMLLEDMCPSSHESLNKDVTRENGNETLNKVDINDENDDDIDVDSELFYNEHGLCFDMSKVCLEHLAGFHSLFLEEKEKNMEKTKHVKHKDKNNVKNNDVSVKPTSRETERMNLSKSIHERLNGHYNPLNRVEIWGEGGYWLGVKRPLPNSLNDSGGVDMMEKAWNKISLLHSHHWSSEFKEWVELAKPAQILSKILYYRKSSIVQQTSKGQQASKGQQVSKEESSLQFLKSRSKGSISYPLEEELFSLYPLTMLHGDYKLNNLFIQKNRYASPPQSSSLSSSSSASSASTSNLLSHLTTPPRSSQRQNRKRTSSCDSNSSLKKNGRGEYNGSFFNQDYNVRMIDWQWCGLGVGAADVSHFILTSCNYHDILYHHEVDMKSKDGKKGKVKSSNTIDYLLLCYYRSLETSYINKLQYKYDEESPHIGFDLFETDSNSEMECMDDHSTTRHYKRSYKEEEQIEDSLSSYITFSEFRRQVSLHMIRYVLDTILYKWSTMTNQDFEYNKINKLHGLDRKDYKHMEANIAIATNCAYWLLQEEYVEDDQNEKDKLVEDYNLLIINSKSSKTKSPDFNKLSSDAEGSDVNESSSVNPFLSFWPSNIAHMDK